MEARQKLAFAGQVKSTLSRVWFRACGGEVSVGNQMSRLRAGGVGSRGRSCT